MRPAQPEGNPLRQRLAGLRRRIRLVATVRGTGWLLSAVLFALLLAGLLDWTVHLPALVRALALVGTLAAGGIIAYRYLLQPLAGRTDDLTLALRVEDRFPSLNDSLASTVQFLEQAETGKVGPGGAESASLRREAVRRALGKAEGFDFRRVVDARGVRIAGLAGFVAAALAVVLTVLFPSVAMTALGRLANPFGGLEWPRKTKLDVAEPGERIGKEQPYRVTGKVWGAVPKEASLHCTYERGNLNKKTVDLKAVDGVARFEFFLLPHEVQSNFSFKIVAGDTESRLYKVQVLPPPTLVPLDGKPSPQLKLTHPRYTGLPSPHQLAPGNGNIDAVYGTKGVFRAAADRPLRKAWIEYRLPGEGGLAEIAELIRGVAATVGARTPWGPIPATLSGERRIIELELAPIVSGGYVLHFEDETGLSNTRAFEINLRVDPRPSVRLVRPSPSRDMLQVLPDAELPLTVVADDPEYGLRSVWLEYRTRGTDAPRVVPLYRTGTGLVPALAPLVGPLASVAPLRPARPARLELNQVLVFKALTHPDGAALREGDEVVLQALADDFDDVTEDKEPGASEKITIRIVGREGLNLAVTEEENKVQRELTELLAKEREAREKVAAVEKKLRRGEKLDAEDRNQLIQAEMQQREEVRKKVGDDKEGLRSRVARLLEALEQNGQRNSSAADRMEHVAKELDRLAKRDLAEIDPKLANARKLAEALDPQARAERQKELKGQAEQAEKEAGAQERAAEQDERAAAQAEKRAAQAADEETKAQRRAEAKRLKERAETERQRARELREDAARDRKEAAKVPDPEEARDAVTEVRKHQEEVEKSLGALLKDMEPSRDIQELKTEAGRIQREQRRLAVELAELAKEERKMAGKSPEELSQEQKADLEALRDSQRRVQEQTNQLLEKMRKVAQKLEEVDRETKEPRDPETAKAIRAALAQAQKEDLVGKMKQAGEDVKENKLNDARRSQKQVTKQLDKLVRNLEDRRDEELDRLIKKLREAEDKVEELTKEQEELKKKLKAAEKETDPAKREAELKKLGRRQDELKKKTEELVKTLSRMRSERAKQALAQANEEMQQAGDELSRGKPDDEKQEDVLDRLDEAREELQKARRRAEEQLGREQLERLADQLRRYKERQEAQQKEAERIQGQARQNEGWSRALQASLRNLAEAQGWGERPGGGDEGPDKLTGQVTGLAQEVSETTKKHLQGTPVFAKQLELAAEAMEKAGRRLHEMAKEPPALAGLPDEDVARSQAEAVRRLAQLLEAVKDAQNAPQPLNKGGGGEKADGGDAEEGGNRRGDDSLPPLAQLRLLRRMQKEVNDRTEAFNKNRPDREKLGAKEKAELESVRRDQKEVADLLEELSRQNREADAEPEAPAPAEGKGGKNGDKKEGDQG